MNKKLILSGAAAFVAAGALAVAPVSAATVNGNSGDTTITYTNNDVVSKNGVYGFVIPASMTFDSSTATPSMDIEMVGVNGYVLTDFNAGLEVTMEAKSANDMKLIDAVSNKEVAYTLAFTGHAGADMTLDTAAGSKANPKEVAKYTPAKPKANVKGALVDPENATVKGTYSDVVTFSWTDNGTILK